MLTCSCSITYQWIRFSGNSAPAILACFGHNLHLNCISHATLDHPILGAEIKLAESHHVDMKELSMDMSIDFVQYQQDDPPDRNTTRAHLESVSASSLPRLQTFTVSVPLLNQPSHDPCIEDDTPGAFALVPRSSSVAEVAVAEQQQEVSETSEPASESYRTSRVFPNSFRVTGIKHIADNLLGSVLNSLPQRFICNYFVVD